MRTLLAFFFVVALCPIVQAQNMQLSLSGGFNLAWRSANILYTPGATPLWRGGFQWEYFPTAKGNFSAGIETAFVEQGFQITGEQTDENGVKVQEVVFVDRNRYADVNLLTKYRFLKGSYRPYVLLTGGTGFYMGSRLLVFDASKGVRGKRLASSVVDNDFFRSVIKSLGVGLGFEKYIGAAGFLMAECRYQHGLSDVLKDAFVSGKARSVSLTLGYGRKF
jgi:hypothetical protein